MKPLLTRFMLFIATILLCYTSFSQSYKWVKGGGSTSILSTSINVESVRSMGMDYNGNVYFLSNLGYTAITADTFHAPSASGSQNILFGSYDCNGNMRFAKLIEGAQGRPYGVTCDITGHVYVAFYGNHYASGTLKIGHDTTIIGDEYRTQAIAQFDTSGNYNWIRFVGPNTLSTLTGAMGLYSHIAMDNANNVHFINSLKYGVQITPTITSHWGAYDLTYDVSGNLLSVNRLDIDSTLLVTGAIIDKPSGKMYVHGYRNADMFPDSSTYSYIAGLDLSRNRIWIDTFINPYWAGNAALGGIVADGYGHLYTTPNAARGFVFRGDTALNAIAAGSSKISSIMKLDTGGNVIWIKTYSGNTGTNSLLELSLMPNNKIATVGVMANRIVSGTDTMNSYPGEGQSAYFTIIDSAGYTQEFQQLHGTGFYDFATNCVSDRVGNLYIGGKVESNIWGGSLTPYTSVGGDSDYFLMKYGVDCSCISMPVANYTYAGSDLNRSFTYTGTMTGVDSVRWTFGDGGTSASMAPMHTYTGAGTFTTCVRVYSSCGNDMRCQEITVACAAAVSSNYSDTGNMVHGFAYTGTMTGYDSVVWDFGDGAIDTGLNVLHTFAAADTYHVCAKVYSNCGTHTWCKDIIVTGTATVSTLAYSVDGIKVFPNPAKEELYISNVPVQTVYRLLNTVGAIIQSGTLQESRDIVQLHQLPPGIYLFELTTVDGQKKVVRFVKQ